MDSLKKSFKTNGSYKQMPRKSSEEHHNLLGDDPTAGIDRKEVVLNMDDNNVSAEQSSKIWRESSYDFCYDSKGINGFDFSGQPEKMDGDDPPSKLIGQFLHKQKASGEMCLDMDLEMDELQQGNQRLSSISETQNHQQPLMSSSNELRVSFNDHVEVEHELVRRRGSNGVNADDEHNRYENGEEVLKCSSNSSFNKKSGLLMSKTKSKSRLLNPPDVDGKSGRTMKSGAIGKNPGDEDDDLFLDEDIPDKFKQEKLNPWTAFQWVSLVLILAVFICSFSIPSFVKVKIWDLHLWKWELMVLVLICGRLVSGWGIRLVVFFIERNFLWRKRVLYFVYGVRKAVQNCLWLGLVLLAWHYIFDKKVESEINSKTLPYVTKVLVCLLVGTLIWLIKTLLVKVLASSFHVSTYFDRIQESLFNQYVIETLSGPPLIEIERNKEEDDKVAAEVTRLQNAGAKMPADLRETALPNKSGKVIGSGGLSKSPRIARSLSRKDFSRQQEEGITIDHLHKLNQKNISAWNMKRLMNIVRHGVLSTLDERIVGSSQEDESAMQIRSEFEAKIAAKKIFTNVAKPGSKFICLVNLMRFMREDEAQKTMSLFEGAKESNRVTKSALKNWVINAFRERTALSLTLNDTKTAVNKLHQMVNMVVAIIIIIIWLLILGIATTHLLVFISSQLLLVVFVFGNTCKMIFEAIIFLFVMHPFDVGDRCEVEGVQMIVEEMNILTTVFLRYDNQKITYPNSVLSTKAISNYYRSPDMGDAIEFSIHVSTSVEKLASMKERIKGYIERKNEHWYPNPTIVIKDVVDMNKLNIAVWLQHRMNHQDMGERWVRRALVVEEMIKIFREFDIEYRMIPLDVNLRNMPASSSTRLPSTWSTCV